MIFKDDVVFLIEEYTVRFGQPPKGVKGATFPRRHDWEIVVSALRQSLDSGKPLAKPVIASQAA